MSEEERGGGGAWARNHAPTVPVVARPRTVMGGPLRVTMLVDAMAVLSLMTIWFLYDITALILGLIIAIHAGCVAIGLKEPHLDTVIGAWTRKPMHTAPRTAQKARFPGAKYVIEP